MLLMAICQIEVRDIFFSGSFIVGQHIRKGRDRINRRNAVHEGKSADPADNELSELRKIIVEKRNKSV